MTTPLHKARKRILDPASLLQEAWSIATDYIVLSNDRMAVVTAARELVENLNLIGTPAFDRLRAALEHYFDLYPEHLPSAGGDPDPVEP